MIDCECSCGVGLCAMDDAAARNGLCLLRRLDDRRRRAVAGPLRFDPARAPVDARTSTLLDIMSSVVDTTDMRLLNVIREQRTARRLTQDELAKLVGVSRQTIVALERGEYTPSTLLALKLAHAFGVPVEDLFRIE